MVNLAISACSTGSDKITLFHPICGKGTTLYEGFIRGFDVKGVEINQQWTEEIQTYVVRFLKKGKYKHKSQKSKQSSSKGKKIANIFSLIAAPVLEENGFKVLDQSPYNNYLHRVDQSIET